MPAISLSSVLLPEPLRPTIPKNSPCSTWKPTSSTAVNWSNPERRKGCSARSLSVCICSCGRLKCFETPSTTMAGVADTPAYSRSLVPEAPPVSVVICTLDREQALRNTLDALRRQTFTDFEVVVVVGPTSDG